LVKKAQDKYGAEKNKDKFTQNRFKSPGGIFLALAKELTTKSNADPSRTIGQQVKAICNKESKRSKKEYAKAQKLQKARDEERVDAIDDDFLADKLNPLLEKFKIL
jgi:hypothetical protein